MIAIPDNIRPYVDAVVRYHFWMLVPLVPLIVLPFMFLTNGWLGSQMDSARSQIESRLSAMRGVAGIQPHPNEAWATDIDARTDAVKLETYNEWRRFWESQQPMRVWPASLGADFVQRAAALRPDAKLPRKLLERYQNGVRAVVRELPARMGADEMMVDAEAGLQEGAGAGINRADPAGQPRTSNRLVVWNAADQKRLYASFNWEKPPSTAQIVLAQEEIWVYGLLCDSIARVNKVAGGAYNAPIPFVEELAIGYPAAEDDPGGARSGRILVPVSSGQAVDAAPPAPEAGGPGMIATRPPHPRFGAAAAMAPPPMPAEEGAAPVVSADDVLRNWIYVDFNGRPLSAAELTTVADAKMVHLMPFVLRVVIDERRLDSLLVELAGSSVPIDVRQVRINASAGGGPAAAPGRSHDIAVELRGTVGLATLPDAKAIGIENLPETEAIPGQPEAAPGAGGQVPPRGDGPAAQPPPGDAARSRNGLHMESMA